MSFYLKQMMGPSTETTRRPINRPEITGECLTAEGIGKILKNGKAVIGWYNLIDVEDFFYAYRIECDQIICEYQGLLDEKMNVHWKLVEAYLLNDKAIESLWKSDWSQFGHLYYDDDHLENQLFIVHNVKLEEILEGAHDDIPFYVDESRFLKRKNAD